MQRRRLARVAGGRLAYAVPSCERLPAASAASTSSTYVDRTSGRSRSRWAQSAPRSARARRRRRTHDAGVVLDAFHDRTTASWIVAIWRKPDGVVGAVSSAHAAVEIVVSRLRRLVAGGIDCRDGHVVTLAATPGRSPTCVVPLTVVRSSPSVDVVPGDAHVVTVPLSTQLDSRLGRSGDVDVLRGAWGIGVLLRPTARGPRNRDGDDEGGGNGGKDRALGGGSKHDPRVLGRPTIGPRPPIGVAWPSDQGDLAQPCGRFPPCQGRGSGGGNALGRS